MSTSQIEVGRAPVPNPPALISDTEREALAVRLDAAHRGQAWKIEPLRRRIQYAHRIGVDVDDDARPADVDDALERVLGTSDLVPGHWLTTGSKISDAVALLQAPDGNATGFLVSPWLLMTNHHVLRTPQDAGNTQVIFRYQQDPRGRIGRTRNTVLDPDRFFVTDRVLDVTLVALSGPDDEPGPGHAFGSLPLIGATGKILLGQPVNIVQHPHGRPREIAIRNNPVLSLTTTHMTYASDTDRGSSGAPVLNDRWELVALHRRSVEATDATGQKIDLNGNPITDTTPASQRHWVANEGVRVSALVAWLTAAAPSLPDSQQALAGQLLAAGGNR